MPNIAPVAAIKGIKIGLKFGDIVYRVAATGAVVNPKGNKMPKKKMLKYPNFDSYGTIESRYPDFNRKYATIMLAANRTVFL